MARENTKNPESTPQTFSISATDAMSVLLVGDFTHWQERPINLFNQAAPGRLAEFLRDDLFRGFWRDVAVDWPCNETAACGKWPVTERGPSGPCQPVERIYVQAA